MAYIGDFDITTVERTSASYGVIPAGVYVAIISKTELVDTKAGDGRYLNVTHQIIEGDYKNRLIWEMVHRVNKNPKTVKQGDEALCMLGEACHTPQFNDSEVFHNIPLLITVKVNAARDNGRGGMWPEKNSIEKWEPLGHGSGAPQKPTRAVIAPSTPVKEGQPPWKRSLSTSESVPF